MENTKKSEFKEDAKKPRFALYTGSSDEYATKQDEFDTKDNAEQAKTKYLELLKTNNVGGFAEVREISK